MGKVHGSLARAGKVKSQTQSTTHLVYFLSFGGEGGNRPKKSVIADDDEGNTAGEEEGSQHPVLTIDDDGNNDLNGRDDRSGDAGQCHVEPQEKKKTPKGRAKKRLTYTRRFVNVTLTGGKRKMNPNPTA
ncbi:40S ribosomal protein S30-B [Colletotrichum spaethianum]|uniref:40S ribosomal protein S30-B n=1 Tax=Colletotrichum spaethianum TaxID=700344 RepID=A0AA37PEP7_9PEZI|nr:40S ribosomal protein S30-B [Colletotrichum spaethianum]GKT50725.1 40S ribosomal protein S30-B [Colletotrichum spaethianum]